MTSRFSKHLLKTVFSFFFFSSLALVLHPLTANAQTGIFIATGSMATARYQHTVTLLANGKVLVAGGVSLPGLSGVLASAELYDPTTGAFSATGSMTTARWASVATLLANGKVLVAGGIDNSGSVLASAELYDPTTGTFSATGPMTTVRYGHAATLLPNGKVLVAGGCGGGGTCPLLASAELYDPTTGTFSATAPMITARYYHSATLLPNGRVLVAGGANNSGPLASAELYDPTTGAFSATGSLTTGRYSQGTAALLSNGKVLFPAGYNSGALASAEIYDPTTGTFSATGPMITARYYHSATLLPNGKVLVAGGTDNSGELASAELYDPATGAFSATGSMTTARLFVLRTATLLHNGKVLVPGGAGPGPSGPLASAELYISVPTDKDECKNNGWMTLFRADGSPFKNQGDCIQFVNTGK